MRRYFHRQRALLLDVDTDAIAAAAAKQRAKERDREGSVARILFAEDDTASRTLMARALSGDGHTVTEAEDGPSALQALKAAPDAFDVLVTDVDMPGLDGIALATQAKALKPGLKVLLMSGFADGLARANALTAGGARTLSKPASLDQLRQEVRTLLG
jgi:two-component system, cell cycle response regulator CpdR